MAGPATAASTLREVHRLRRHAKELHDEIERAPRILKARQAKITAQETALKEGQDEVKRLKVSSLEKESQLKATQVTIAKHEKQKNEATSKKEYDALGVEIASDKKKCQGLEDEILEALTKIDEQVARIPALEAVRRRVTNTHRKKKQGRADGLRQERQGQEQSRPSKRRPPTRRFGLYNASLAP